MKIRSVASKSLRLVVVLTLTIGAFSCNRGYGCPTNFSLQEWFGDLLQLTLTLLR